MERPLARTLLVAAFALALAGCSCCEDKAAAPAPSGKEGSAMAEMERDEDAGKESPVDLASLPANVRAAAEAAAPGLKVTASQMEEEDGVPVYEVSGTVDGAVVEVLVTPEGKVLIVEKSIPFASLPEAVRSAASARLPGLVVSRAEEIRRAGAGRAEYELRGNVEGKVYELKLSDSGEVLEIED